MNTPYRLAGMIAVLMMALAQAQGERPILSSAPSPARQQSAAMDLSTDRDLTGAVEPTGKLRISPPPSGLPLSFPAKPVVAPPSDSGPTVVIQTKPASPKDPPKGDVRSHAKDRREHACHRGCQVCTCFSHSWVLVIPPPVTRDSYAYYADAPAYVPSPPAQVNATTVSYSTVQVPPPASVPPESQRDYYHLGQEWGRNLREGVVTWGEFVNHLRVSLLRTTPDTIANFRSGFLEGYGLSADAVFRVAMQRAVI